MDGWVSKCTWGLGVDGWMDGWEMDGWEEGWLGGVHACMGE